MNINSIYSLFMVIAFVSCSSTSTSQPTQQLEPTVEPWGRFGIPQERWDEIWEDDKVSIAEKRYMYETYYEELPTKFRAAATYYGPDSYTYGELLGYGVWLRQQMWRGYVLIASGDYGFYDCRFYLEAVYSQGDFYRCYRDNLLSAQKSQMYYFFADMHKDKNGQPQSVIYNDLNDRQKRIYDLTSCDLMEKICRKKFFVPIGEISTDKYIAIISCKSPNDFGRRFYLYKTEQFVGVVICGGEAKRDDWTGLGSPTNDNFKFNRFPLAIRIHKGDHWAFDFPDSVYELFGGTTGHVSDIIAIDPDK